MLRLGQCARINQKEEGILGTVTIAHAVDASFDLLTIEEAQCLKGNNTALFAQCLWTGAMRPANAIRSLRNARNMGLRIAGYISLNRHHSGVWHAAKGCADIAPDLWDAMEFVAVDIELDGVRIEEIVAAVNRVKELGQRPILYTNYNSWTTKVVPRNPQDIAQMDVLLWNAYWDMNPDIDFPRLRFGGWRPDQVMIEQWSGGTHVCGTFVDRNSVVLELLDEGNGGEEDMGMTPQELGRLAAMEDQLRRTTTDALDGRDRSAENKKRIEQVFAYSNGIDKAILEKQAAILVELKQTQQGLMNAAVMLLNHLHHATDVDTPTDSELVALEMQIAGQGASLATLDAQLTDLMQALHAATEEGERLAEFERGLRATRGATEEESS